MKPTTALLASALLALSVASCSTVEYVEVRPSCTPPASPALPSIDRGELWDRLGDAEYRVLERYINGVWAHADESVAMLEELCGA